LPFREENIIHG